MSYATRRLLCDAEAEEFHPDFDVDHSNKGSLGTPMTFESWGVSIQLCVWTAAELGFDPDDNGHEY